MNESGKSVSAVPGAVTVPMIKWTGEDGDYYVVDVYGTAEMTLRVEIHVAWARVLLRGGDREDDGWECCATARLGDIAAEARAEDVPGTPRSVSRRLAAEAVASLIAQVRDRLGVK